jgi:hypothetical protein
MQHGPDTWTTTQWQQWHDANAASQWPDYGERPDDTVRLPNLTRAAFCQRVLALCERFELPYSAEEDSLYHLCEAIAIQLFVEGDRLDAYCVLRTFIQARGIVRFSGE